MNSLLYYLFQVLLCSGILMGYYALVLRDKKFHQYNRFYLMGVILLSWTVPLIEINWTGKGQGQVTEVVNFIAGQNAQWKQSPVLVWTGTEVLALVVYTLVGAVLLGKMAWAYRQLWRLQKQHTHTVVGQVKFFQTDLGEAPFSFFNAIFWNRAIDPQTQTGQKMMAHELAHVREKHSFDKMLLQANRALGWFNPFFWLLAKEMDMVHEFIADQKAVAEGDAAALAEILLAAAQPTRFLGLTHPFFFSPIQRRLKMIASKNKTSFSYLRRMVALPSFSYLRRMVALPLLALVLVLVSFKQKDASTTRLSMATVMENLATPVLNAGADLAASSSATDTVVLSPDSVYVVPSGKKIKLIDDPNGTSTVREIRVVGQKGPGFSAVDSSQRSTAVFLDKPSTFNSNGQNPLVILDGVKVPYAKFKDLNPNDIALVNVKKDKTAVLAWGDEGKYGVIEIYTKAYSKANKINVAAIPVEGHPLPGLEGQEHKVVEGKPLKVVEGRKLTGYSKGQVDSMRSTQHGEVIEVEGYALPEAPKVVEKTTLVLNGRVISWKDLENMPADRIAGIKIEKGKGGSAKKIIILEKVPKNIEVIQYTEQEFKKEPPPPPPAQKKKSTAPPPPPPPVKKSN
ncbi:MAG: hypothetical protein EAZ62_05255 [Sphingobacteriia bacterium]|nr:MAG: hypothetical protein EAZ62_05255 [Sphingobacteriia bacterium]